MAQNDKNSQTDLDGLEKMGMPDGQPRPIACLPIIGQIEGHMALSDSSKTTKYEHILPMLVDIEQNDKVQGLLLLLNTVGGDVAGTPSACRWRYARENPSSCPRPP